MEESSILKPGVSIKPEVDIENIKLLVKDIYGLEVISIKELNGYDDKNYKIFVSEDVQNEFIEKISKTGYVFKIINSLDSKNEDVFDGQTCVMLHLEQKGIKCPKPIKSKTGKYFTQQQLSSGKHLVRLLEYIDGTIFNQVPSTPKLFYDAGKYIAEIGEKLKDFNHKIYETHRSLWMMDSVPKLSEFIFAITDPTTKTLLESIIEEFKSRVLSTTQKLETGMIHGDYNEQNIIVNKNGDDWIVDAVIDLGDTQKSCYLYELAITMTYMIIQGRDLDVGGYVLAGYQAVRKIPEEEFSLLKITILARFCTSLIMASYSIMGDPENEYLLSTSKHGWTVFHQLYSAPEEELLNRWRKISDNFKISS